MVLDPNTHQGTLMRYEYPTKILCMRTAANIAKSFDWNKVPDCKKQEKVVKGQHT